MKISYRWLKEYIAITSSPEELAALLTSTGLEVEHTTTYESVKGLLAGLVVGEVITCVKHPNADRLLLTSVDVGSQQPLQIVCGATNVKAGIKVVVAVSGTIINPIQGNPFTIMSTKIRGERSEGMICAEDEIGLGVKHEGIIILDAHRSPLNGEPVADYYGVFQDTIFEIGLTPNRGDASSHIGVAREIKAICGLALQYPSVEQFTTHNPLPFSVRVENEEACPRYTAIVLSNVKIAASPQWLVDRLAAIGVKSINNVVDVTNYVCHELGQPLHAFDAETIVGNNVVVKNATPDMTFVTLDGKTRTLTPKDLMICDAHEGMCIAGVLGGSKHGITAQTTTVFLESAYFHAECIRRTAHYHRITTDASFRYERGADPQITLYALQRAALLIQTCSTSNVTFSEVIDLYPKPLKNRKITVHDDYVDSLIGKHIPRKDAWLILKNLDIDVVDHTTNSYVVSVPPYRVGITQEVDVIEEILRMHGFSNIPLQSHIEAVLLPHYTSKSVYRHKRRISELLTARGYHEIITNSLVDKELQSNYASCLTGEAVELLCPSNEALSALRQTMLFSGLEVCAHNIHRRQKNLKFFDFGRIYCKNENHYKEEGRMAIYLSGNMTALHWKNTSRLVDYFDMAQSLHDVIHRLIPDASFTFSKIEPNSFFNYSVQWLWEGTIVATAGLVSDSLKNEYNIKQDVFYGEICTDVLFQKQQKTHVAMRAIPRYPEVKRDLSLVLDTHIPFAEVKQLSYRIGGKHLKQIALFDVYQSDNIPKGKKAYGLEFIIGDSSRTMKDIDIEKIMIKLTKSFEKEMGAQIRQ